MTDSPDILWGEEILRAGHVLRLDGIGTSMEPAIPAGATLIIHPAHADDVALGDVVVFRRDSTLVAHRLIGRRREGGRLIMKTKGDILPGPDAPVAAERIIGRVVATEHDGRRRRFDTCRSRLTGLVTAHALPLLRNVRARLRPGSDQLCTTER